MKQKWMKKMVMGVGLCLLISGLMGSFASAQVQQSDNMQILHEKIKADKKLLVAENMQLTETEAKNFWPVYDKYQNELFILRIRGAKLIEDYAKNYESMTNDAAKKLLDEYLTIEDLRQKVRVAYLPEFRKVLPEMKVTRYYQIENKINAILNFEAAKQIPLVKTFQ